MNREIKFRGRAINIDEWVYGDFYSLPNSQTGEVEPLIASRHYSDDGSFLHTTSFIVDPKTVGQYTGLTMKDREVYEGDAFYYRDGSNSCYLVVKWDDDRLAWDYIRVEDGVLMHGYNGWGLLEDSEYIGTIHDNPELL